MPRMATDPTDTMKWGPCNHWKDQPPTSTRPDTTHLRLAPSTIRGLMKAAAGNPGTTEHTSSNCPGHPCALRSGGLCDCGGAVESQHHNGGSGQHHCCLQTHAAQLHNPVLNGSIHATHQQGEGVPSSTTANQTDGKLDGDGKNALFHSLDFDSAK